MDTRTPISAPARGFSTWMETRGSGPGRYAAQADPDAAYHDTIADTYVTFYEAMPDKNGEVWAGALHGGRFLRFNRAPSDGSST